MTTLGEKIRGQLKAKGIRHYACDNISGFVGTDELEALQEEVEEGFRLAMSSMLIDPEDPNSADTPKRLAKMYMNELFEGRYFPPPKVTAFPNEGEDLYDGMIFIRADLKSVCSHHHQPVQGVAYIGVMPGEKIIGLSKYIRLAQWHGRRGTLQEELTKRICRSIAEHTKSSQVAVHIAATHGCVSCRGVKQMNSNTRTTYMTQDFRDDKSLKKEFFDQVMMEEAK